MTEHRIPAHARCAWADGDHHNRLASNLNFAKGQTVPNLVLARSAPTACPALQRVRRHRPLIADISGYYRPGTPLGAGAVRRPLPNRVLDTRTWSGGLTPGRGPRTVRPSRVTGLGGGAPSSAPRP